MDYSDVLVFEVCRSIALLASTQVLGWSFSSSVGFLRRAAMPIAPRMTPAERCHSDLPMDCLAAWSMCVRKNKQNTYAHARPHGML